MNSRRFYIFCDLLNPQTAHNLRFTGGFASAGAGSVALSGALGSKFAKAYYDGSAEYAPFIPNKSEKLAHIMSPFWMNVTADYRVEYDAELARVAYAPKAPSRFSAIFAFGDWETCQTAADKWGWSLGNVSVFQLEPGPYSRIAKVNMEVVSTARHAYRFSSFSAKELDSIWKHYWTGKGDITIEVPQPFGKRTVTSGVIWEYLIEGRVTRLNINPNPDHR